MLKLRTTLLHKVMNEATCKYHQQEIPVDSLLTSIMNLMFQIKKEKRKVCIIGNGGSAGIASHFAIDLLNVLKVPVHTLYDSNQMTCMANDFGYEQIFSRPLEVVLNEKDLLVAISSSGRSQNIVNALDVALEKKAYTFTLSGFSKDNPLRSRGTYDLWVDAEDYGLVEMAHFCILHTLIDMSQAVMQKETVYVKN